MPVGIAFVHERGLVGKCYQIPQQEATCNAFCLSAKNCEIVGIAFVHEHELVGQCYQIPQQEATCNAFFLSAKNREIDDQA